jgi:hypothetical protein
MSTNKRIPLSTLKLGTSAKGLPSMTVEQEPALQAMQAHAKAVDRVRTDNDECAKALVELCNLLITSEDHVRSMAATLNKAGIPHNESLVVAARAWNAITARATSQRRAVDLLSAVPEGLRIPFKR